MMLKDSEAFSGFSVDDVDAANEFYSGVLGLERRSEHGQLHLHLAGGRDIWPTPKGPAHQPATYPSSTSRCPTSRRRSTSWSPGARDQALRGH